MTMILYYRVSAKILPYIWFIYSTLILDRIISCLSSVVISFKMGIFPFSLRDDRWHLPRFRCSNSLAEKSLFRQLNFCNFPKRISKRFLPWYNYPCLILRRFWKWTIKRPALIVSTSAERFTAWSANESKTDIRIYLLTRLLFKQSRRSQAKSNQKRMASVIRFFFYFPLSLYSRLLLPPFLR